MESQKNRPLLTAEEYMTLVNKVLLKKETEWPKTKEDWARIRKECGRVTDLYYRSGMQNDKLGRQLTLLTLALKIVE